MSTMRFMDMLKLTFRVMEFKYEQRKLTTTITANVETTKGTVKGVKRLSIWGPAYYSFEKIPYAQPPLGELRFRAPVPARPWQGVLDCTSPAEKPLQTNVLFSKYKGSEDCLYLNVFTKNLNTTQLKPVMVWIYGGGFQVGEASRDMYSPDYFMTKDVVVVTIAYRLGAFGFLSLDDPAANVPGNAGIKDQILSLKWVQENISRFGGDPNNVTVFGESAGGASTHLCMLSEQSKGLMHKGIIMSGSALCPWALPPKNHWAFRLAKILGYTGDNRDCAVLQFLQQVQGHKLVLALSSILNKEEKHHRVLFAFGPVIEPYVTEQCILSMEPRELMQTTWSNGIPMLIGGTSFEGLLFYSEITRRPATLNEVKNCLNLLPADAGLHKQKETATQLALDLKQLYFGKEECSRQTMMQFLELESYREFWHPIYRTALARLQHQNTAPTYLYRFDYDSKEGNCIRNLLCGKDVRGACHGDDLCYIYYAMFSHKATKDSTESLVIRTMIDVWTSFALDSDPNCDMLAELNFEPLQPESAMKCLNISENTQFIELPELQKLKLWNSFYAQGKL